MEAALDFSARVMSEMLPPDGPVKSYVVGDPSDEKEDRAKRTSPVRTCATCWAV